MADNNTMQISKVLIDTTGDGYGDKIAHFAADINNFMVYDDDGAESSVKDLVFGITDPDTFKSTDTKDNSMWGQLNTKAQECYDILDKNKNFWSGLSQASYAETTNGDYLASGAEVKKVNFYGDDVITAEADRKKLVSLGALEDFAKRVSSLGGSHNIGQNHVALNPNSQATGINSFAVNGGVAWGNNSVALNGGQAMANNSVAIGDGTYTSKEGQIVLGQYNAKNEDAILIIGTGTSDANRKNSLIIDKNGNIQLPKIREGSSEVGIYNYIDQNPDINYTLPNGFIEGVFKIGCRTDLETWLGGQLTFSLEKGVPFTKTLTILDYTESSDKTTTINAKVTYDGSFALNIKGIQGVMATGSTQAIPLTLMYAEMCAINFF